MIVAPREEGSPVQIRRIASVSSPELHSPNVSRRLMLQWSAASIVGLSAGGHISAQPAPASVPENIASLNRFPRMMQDYFATRIARSQELGQTRRAAIASKSDAEAYVTNTRERIRDCFGPLPERTPLKPRILGIVERETYRIEKVVFESRPDFLVTANLYVPKGRSFPLPGVIGTCGHSLNGKAAEAYQSFAQGLARQGYVVLIYDPIGQGERLQYSNEQLKSKVGAGVHEHLLCGNQQSLVGEFHGTWHAWDGIRALDYLLTRPEVDPAHVGVTGNSGGGTLTMWLCGLESRWTMAAPSCAVTSFQRNFANELPTDTEQCPPRVLLHGLDHADFLVAMAPKPVIILAAEKDYFDVRGSIEAYERLKPIYRWLGAEENIRLFIGPNPHGFTQPNREAMYQFFNLQTGIAQGGHEPPLVIEEDATLQCLPDGQVARLQSRTVFSFTSEASQQLRTRRGDVDADALKSHLDTLIPARPTEPPKYDILRSVSKRRYPKPSATCYSVETEPQIRAIVYRLDEAGHSSRLPQRPGRAVVYLAHHSSDAELRDEPLVKSLLRDEADSEFYAVDLRGIGDSRPDTCGENQFLLPYGSDYFYSSHAIMFGESYPVLRTFDVLRVIDWLKACGRTEIHLAALGWGSVPATLAAVVSDVVKQVTLKGSLRSFSALAEQEHYHWPRSSMIPDVLKHFDLPDCYRFIESTKRISFVEGPEARSE